MNLFFELIQVAIGHRDALSRIPSDTEWNDIYNTSLKQAIAGVMFSGVERLPQKQIPPKEIVLKWFSLVNRIEARNRRMNEAAVKVSNKFRKDGFRNAILKGQGIATLYPNPLRRQSGDIDIWLEGTREDITAYVRSFTPDVEALYHHIQFPVIHDVDIEVHFMPSFCINPFTDKKIQSFFSKEASFDNYIELPDNAGKIAVPTERLNRIFLLRHAFGHFIGEGIGMRQVMDYYFLLCASDNSNANMEEHELLKGLGMYKFAGALMYVLHHIFGIAEDKMLTPVNEQEGRFLLKEIMQTGNFGHDDNRTKENKADSHLGRFLSRQRFYMRMFHHYPKEVIWMPYFDIKRFFTAKRK